MNDGSLLVWQWPRLFVTTCPPAWCSDDQAIRPMSRRTARKDEIIELKAYPHPMLDGYRRGSRGAQPDSAKYHHAFRMAFTMANCSSRRLPPAIAADPFLKILHRASGPEHGVSAGRPTWRNVERHCIPVCYMIRYPRPAICRLDCGMQPVANNRPTDLRLPIVRFRLHVPHPPNTAIADR